MLLNKSGAVIKDVNGQPYVPETPDANSLIDIGGTPYLVTHFEYQNLDSNGTSFYGKLPMTMTLAKLGQNSADGKFTVSSINPISFSGVNGLWIPCAGSR